MKRAYIKPTTVYFDIETEQLMAASPGVKFDNGGNGFAGLNDTDATGDALSKGHSFNLWDDDEEE